MMVQKLDKGLINHQGVQMDFSALPYQHFLPVFTTREAALEWAGGDESVVLSAKERV